MTSPFSLGFCLPTLGHVPTAGDGSGSASGSHIVSLQISYNLGKTLELSLTYLGRMGRSVSDR